MYREQYGEYANWCWGVKGEVCTQFHFWFCVLLALSANNMWRKISQREPVIVYLYVWLANRICGLPGIVDLDTQNNFFFFCIDSVWFPCRESASLFSKTILNHSKLLLISCLGWFFEVSAAFGFNLPWLKSLAWLKSYQKRKNLHKVDRFFILTSLSVQGNFIIDNFWYGCDERKNYFELRGDKLLS